MKFITILFIWYFVFIGNVSAFNFNNTDYINGINDGKLIITGFINASYFGNASEIEAYNILVDQWNNDLKKTGNKTLYKQLCRYKLKEKTKSKITIILEDV